MNAEELQQQIREWKEKRNAVILAPNYADEEREHVWMQCEGIAVPPRQHHGGGVSADSTVQK